MKRISITLALALVSCLAGTSVFALETPRDGVHEQSPQQVSGSTRVDAEGLLGLYSDKPQLVVIDARIAGDRKFGYIEKSISLPDTDTRCETLADVIPALDSPVAFYCNGPKCGRSANAARIAGQCGYHEIYWFRGGIEEWSAKQYPLLK